MGGVTRPHLRNVFFRTSALLAIGVKPVFVMDGAAPALKKETMEIRKAASQSQSQLQSQTTEVKSLSRTRLKGLMNECKFLLASLGITCLQGKGEGEALCAQLDSAGLVDAGGDGRLGRVLLRRADGAQELLGPGQDGDGGAISGGKADIGAAAGQVQAGGHGRAAGLRL